MSPSVCKLYVDADGVKVMPRIGYVFLCKQYMYKSSKHLSTRAAPATRAPGLLSSTTTVSTLFRCGNSLSPHLSCYPSRKSRLEGGRKVYVVLTTFVRPDPELYMTEYAAIRIVFTLQGLYTCTHSRRRQLAATSTDPEAPA